MRLVKTLRVLALWLVIPVGALVQLQMVSTMMRTYIAVGVMRDQLQRSGLGHVTSLRGIPQVCREEGFLDGIDYTYAVDVAKIPDAYWASEDARQRHWHHAPFDDSQSETFDGFIEYNARKPGCPQLPALRSPHVVITVLYSEAGDLGPRTVSSNGDGFMAYDTRTSRLYWAYAGN
ncbi:hypothetical protein [Xanthomonas sp. SI]|uniref:hypothetical protein n=1 Tax=Xanthomonas sp. SI TaxID=2724123 RepID=UPI00163A58B5|nr:hypothetical protein [Xanthomonas sp. SI]QNH10679.1 hypothetical protein HEP75_00082 [Xanthomonas sp. SI]